MRTVERLSLVNLNRCGPLLASPYWAALRELDVSKAGGVELGVLLAAPLISQLRILRLHIEKTEVPTLIGCRALDRLESLEIVSTFWLDEAALEHLRNHFGERFVLKENG